MNDRFDCFSPTDFRYYIEDLMPYLSEDACIRYQCNVELALIKTLAKFGICPENVVREVEEKIKKVTAKEIYKEKDRIKHGVKALVNILKEKVDEAKPYIHLTATSADIIDSTDALRYRDATKQVILPDMMTLEKILIETARKEKNTLQIGRTHGQHAVPITFGFAIAQYVERWGDRILKVKESAENLVGMLSGAVGAYNASSLLFENPEEFEKQVLNELGLKPARISTQVIPPEPITDFAHSIISSFGVLANYADDMRHLQRTEISEVKEPFGKEQVGSSTMPQKQNPENWESIKSIWKEFMPRIISVYLDQISEHQRDLTNSASERYTPEILVMFDHSVRRATSVSHELYIDKKRMRENFELSKDKIIAEPLQILLSSYKHPDAHEKVRVLTMQSYKINKPLIEIIFEDEELKPYLEKFSQTQIEILRNPEKYTGIASKKAEEICDFWENKLSII